MAKSLPAAITAGKGGDSERVIFAKIIPEPGDAWEDFFWATKSVNVIKKTDTGFVNHQGILLEDFETFGDWSKFEGDSIADNTTEYKEGAHSLKINSVNGAACSAEKTISKDLSGADNFVFWLYVHDDLTKNDYIVIYFSSVTDYSKYMVGTISGSQFKKGWNRLVICKSFFSANGGESWSNTMIRLRFRGRALAGENASFSFDDFRYNYKARAKCIIAFDDVQDDVHDKAYPIMNGNGQAGVSFVITDSVGAGGYMTKAQLETLRDAGWDISNHSKTHPDLTTLGSEDLDTEVNDAYDWLVANGFSDSAIFFSYPYGAYNDTVITKVKENHKIARATHRGDFQAHFTYDDDNIDFILKCLSPSNTTPVATVKGWIDRTIENNGLLILLFHKIVDADADESTEYLTADFEEISDYLKTKEDAGDMQVITFSNCYREVYDGSVLAQSNFSPISQSVDIRQGGNIAKVGGLSLKVLNPEFSGSNRFDEIFAEKNMENRTIEIKLGFYTGSDLDETDLLLLYRGIIEDMAFNYGAYQIKIRDAGFKRHKRIPDLILDESSYPKVPESNKGAVVPLVYGSLSFGDLFYVDDIYRVPAYKSNREKEEYLVSRNKTSDAAGEACVFVYFSDINRYGVIYLSSGSFSITYERPTKLAFPLDAILKGKFYSQGEAQGSQTNPTSIDFHNAVDDDLNSYFTLGNSEQLYLKFPMPSDFAEIVSGMTTIYLSVRFGTITGSAHPAVAGTLKYYNPDDDTFSSGQTFTVNDSNDINFGYSVSLTWDQLQRFEFGITMESDATAQIKNIWIVMNNMLIRGIITPPPRSTFAHYHTTQTGEPRLAAEIKEYGAKFKTPLMIYTFLVGERFGSWIDGSRNNGHSLNESNRYTYILECILRSELGLSNGDINEDAFDSVGNTADGDRKDWLFDGIIEEQKNSLDIFADFCRQAAIIYYENYQNKAAIKALKKQTAVKTIDRTTIQEDTIRIPLSKLSEVYNEFYLYYRRMNNDNYGSMFFVTASDHNLSSNTRSGTPNTYTGLCSNSQDKYKQTKRFNFKCDWFRDDATAELFIKWLIEWYCYRKYIAPFETAGLDHIDLELGDQVKIDHTLLPDGISNSAHFMLFDISHDLNNDRMKFKFMQIPDLLP